MDRAISVQDMRKLNILLVKPYSVTNERQPPLGLGYIASAVREHNIKIVDCIQKNWKVDELKNYLEENTERGFDIIGIQCYTVDLNTVRDFSRAAKKIMPNAIVLVGGPQPTLDPKGTLDYLSDVDYLFVGEAEISFPKFVEIVAKNRLNKTNMRNIPGIAYRMRKKIQVTERVFVENLDKFEPSWELYDIKNYPLAPLGAFCKQYPTAPLVITRGCPFNCKFCGGPLIAGRKIRAHSVDYVIRQIEFLAKNYGVREIHMMDDNFTMDKQLVEGFCKNLIKKKLGITWACLNGVRVDTLDPRLLRLMKRSGLYSVSIGIESGSDRILRLMNKNLTTEQVEEKVRMIRKEGLGIIGFFILGYPGETEDDINKTIDFACKLPLKRAGFSAFKPFPGTQVYDMLVEQEKIKKLDWENFSLDKIAWTPNGISAKRLKNLRRKALLKFYLRPHIMIRVLSEIKNFENFKFILVRIYRWLS